MTSRFVPDEAPRGLYGSAAYLAACAAHEGARFGKLVAGEVALPALQNAAGVVTPYGYPQPVGVAESWDATASALLEAPFPWRIALAPVGSGGELAQAIGMHLRPVHVREICLHDLDSAEEPVNRFSGKARAKVRRARREGVRIEFGPVSGEFGARYRAETQALGADPIYLFDDDYFEAMNEAGGWQTTAHDDAGTAAAALFLTGGEEGSYHLSWRRNDPPPVAGTMNLLLAAALARCRDLGVSACYLGGGRTTDSDDPLLVFKRSMATRVVTRPTFAAP